MRNAHKTSAHRRDHYQELTDKIIAALETGTAPWRRSWDKTAGAGATAPVNAATGHRYRGINLFVLGMSPRAMSDPRWCSYRQAAERGRLQGSRQIDSAPDENGAQIKTASGKTAAATRE
jgi:antirestriction protein ArdC